MIELFLARKWIVFVVFEDLDGDPLLNLCTLGLLFICGSVL
jgi:hypothetical protein